MTTDDPRAALIATWRTRGHVLDDDGAVTETFHGTDAYAWLGDGFVVHHVDVEMDGRPVRALEMIGPLDPAAGTYPTWAFDGATGTVDTSYASVDAAGIWSFGESGGARSVMRIAADGRTATGDWTRPDGVPWMHLDLERLD